MAVFDTASLTAAIGREQKAVDLVTPRLAHSLCAILDIEPGLSNGDLAPPGIHWCLTPDIVSTKNLGVDGHPAVGGFMPETQFPRRMWAAGEIIFNDRLRVGDEVERTATIENIQQKQGRSGEMIFVTVGYRFATRRGDVIEERRDIVYRQPHSDIASTVSQSASEDPCQADMSWSVDVNPVMLFRYSAITFNGHRIHYDLPYATEDEGYGKLVVHGPLQATFLLNLITTLQGGCAPERFRFRAVRPAFSGPLTFNAQALHDRASLWAADAAGHIVMQAQAE